MKERFLGLYDLAFDKEGNIQACGRDVCKELIALSNQIEKDVKHGDETTGMMDVENIKKLHQVFLYLATLKKQNDV